MEIELIRTSATAKLANRMFKLCSFNPLFIFAANITKMFRRMATGQTMIVVAAAILIVAVSLKTQTNTGSTGQKKKKKKRGKHLT